MRIDVLDMGTTRYGDCILIRQGNRSILIDGAHPGDTAFIRDQLKRLLGHAPPFEIDLLVVTHCHSDHIGCLPALTRTGDLVVKTALVADEKFGWGRGADGQSPIDSMKLSLGQQKLVAALQEENRADSSQAELEEFLMEDVTLEENYIEMLQQLKDQGSPVIRFGRSPATMIQQLEADFADFGLQLLGPTQDHLILCAEAIAQGVDAIGTRVAEFGLADDVDISRLTRLYQVLARQDADAPGFADQPGVGAAKNNQSITLKVSADSWSALLAGDMQFAKEEVPDLNEAMTALRQAVIDAGPYDFIKLTHHTSYNAVNFSVLDEWSDTKLFAHTGGSNDPNHPDQGALELLQSRQDQLTFARTDRNGIITVTKNGMIKMTPSRGQLNDFTMNQDLGAPEPPVLVSEAQRSASIQPGTARDESVVEVVARIPHQATRVTLTVKVEPGEATLSLSEQSRIATTQASAPELPTGSSVSGDVPQLKFGDGRSLPKLLFVTSRSRLATNIGTTETARIFEALRNMPSLHLVDLPPTITSAEDAARFVRPELAIGDYKGVVLLGGYDVVPAHQLDVLDAALRQELEAAGLDGQDADNFIVWSDELYGDKDGDFKPEIPVSRIPDGRRWDVVFGALQAPLFASGGRFGVRNLNRPFATGIFPRLPGQGGNLEISELFAPINVQAGAAAGAVYFMLHGSSRDAARFWGETTDGTAYEAFAVENVPEKAPGSIVFTGCCWGALVMSPPAVHARPDVPLRPRGPESSLAIAYLRAGVLAFLGCTGTHYSPRQPPYNYFGKPMHDAFWKAIGQGYAPAESLYLAKKEFARGMPHGMTDPFSKAVEVKILRQYTCLGLGW
jgi:beta-lactamase superfamily II metal-dependent hydrolase